MTEESGQEPSRDELESRVEQLEQTVQRMMPNRRQALKGLGVLGAGGLLGASASSASASTGSAGQIGTSTDRPDIFGDSVDANSVNTDELLTEPNGVRLTKSTNQSIPNDSLTAVAWDNAEEYNTDAPSFADLSNNRITIPNDDYSYARVEIGTFWAAEINDYEILLRKNGGAFEGGGDVRGPGPTLSPPNISSSWVAVSAGDSFTAEIKHITGSSVDLRAIDTTWLDLHVL